MGQNDLKTTSLMTSL